MGAETSATPSGWRARWPTIGVRARVLATVLTLTAVAMALAGAVQVLVQRAAATDRADRTIARDVAEFRVLAKAGADPNRPFTSVGVMLQAAIQRQVPAEDETYLGLVDGRPAWIPSGPRPVRLEAQPSIVGTVAPAEEARRRTDRDDARRPRPPRRRPPSRPARRRPRQARRARRRPGRRPPGIR